jgi:hypothetical protein
VILAAPDVLKLSTTSALSAILDFSLPTVLRKKKNFRISKKKNFRNSKKKKF